MTLFVDRRKDNYDELLVLARDARQSRARANRWSAALVAGAIVGTGAYVASMNEQVDDLRETAQKATVEREAIEARYEQAMVDKSELAAEIDSLNRYRQLYSDIVPTKALSESITKLVERIDPNVRPTEGGQTTIRQVALSNIVWMVEGSRRFPVINGDILWIPDLDFWIRYESESNSDGDITKHILTQYPTQEAAINLESGSGKILDLPYVESVKRNTSDCVRIIAHDKSLRPLFRAQKYSDIEVTYYTSVEPGNCRAE